MHLNRQQLRPYNRGAPRGHNASPLVSSATSSRDSCKRTTDSRDNIITIKVCDEKRGITKDFLCEKSKLLRHMKYFKKHLEASNSEEIEISVHCDIHIFEWLYSYMKNPESTLEVPSVVSIVISADFLGMDSAVERAVRFLSEHLEEVLKLPIDMNCLNNKLLSKIAKEISPMSLERLRDSKDKLRSKLFMKKLHKLLKNTVLMRCVNCGNLYTAEQFSVIPCTQSKAFVDFHGSVVSAHEKDANWDTAKFMVYLKSQQLPWRALFWKLWARKLTFECKECGISFVGSELSHCKFHSETPVFTLGAIKGHYPCCGRTAIRFNVGQVSNACKAKDHYVIERSEEFKQLCELQDIVQEPFGNSKEISLADYAKKCCSKMQDMTEEEDDLDMEFYNDFPKLSKKTSKVKKRAWKLQALRMQDFNNMKVIKQEVQKHRKKL